MRIAICDDEKIFCEKLYMQVKRIFQNLGKDVEVSVFYDGRTLKQKNHEQVYDIIFLDVELKDENGFSIAKDIGQQYHSKIIFISNHEEWVQEAFKVHAQRYLYKTQVSDENLKEAIISCIREMNDNTYISVILKNKKVKKIKMKDIVYIESLGDDLCIHKQNEYMIAKGTLKKMETILDNRFGRCHHQYIVNYQYIDDYNKSQLFMTDCAVLPLSRAKKKEFLEAFQNYLLQIDE